MLVYHYILLPSLPSRIEPTQRQPYTLTSQHKNSKPNPKLELSSWFDWSNYWSIVRALIFSSRANLWSMRFGKTHRNLGSTPIFIWLWACHRLHPIVQVLSLSYNSTSAHQGYHRKCPTVSSVSLSYVRYIISICHRHPTVQYCPIYLSFYSNLPELQSYAHSQCRKAHRNWNCTWSIFYRNSLSWRLRLFCGFLS